MCFSFELRLPYAELKADFELQGEPPREYQGTLFPKLFALVIGPGRKPDVLPWGFQHPTLKKAVFNAKAETVAKNSLFRCPLKTGRCLIPATAFFENDREKRKYRISVPEGRFAIAGLFRPGEMTMLTCGPNPFMERLHHRMPVILGRANYDRWLEDGGTELLVPYPGELTGAVIAEPKRPTFRQGELF